MAMASTKGSLGQDLWEQREKMKARREKEDLQESKEATSDCIGVLHFYTDAAGGVCKTSVWWLISTSTFYFQPPAHMSRQRVQRRHSSGSGVPHLRWGLHRCVNSCNGCWVGSHGERMFKRARGTDVAGKRLPRQTIPKSMFEQKV